MNDGFKQRLVGALVLICIAVILWPIIFSDPNQEILGRSSQIPDMPVFEKYSVAKPQRPDNIEPVIIAPVEPEAVKPASTADNRGAAPKPQQPGQDSRGLPKSWVLQVASFSQASNAEELKRALQKKGYKAFTRKVGTQQGSAIRVYIGPKLSKTAFNKSKPRIDKAFSVNSMVVRFNQ